MKITILTLGTRGDVQPYAVLGKALKERGHEVVLSTTKDFESFIKSYGLDFIPIEADFQAMINSEERNKIKNKPWLAKKYMNEFVNPLMRDSLYKFYTIAKDSDKVLFHNKTMADNFADQFPEKMIKTDIIPLNVPTSAFSNPILSSPPIPRFLNKFSYKLNELSLKMWTKPIREFCQDSELALKFKKPDLPSIYGISELLLPKPTDYPTNSYFTGFWFDNSSSK
jgi:sterol 3beta-glucosyltransferase